METLTLHVAEWIGVNCIDHRPLVSAYERKQARHPETGIPIADAYGDSKPIRVACPDGWHIADTIGCTPALFDADGNHVDLIHDGKHLTGIVAGGSVLLPIVE